MNNRPLVINAYFLAHPYSGQGVYTCQLIEECIQQYSGPIILLSLDARSRTATEDLQKQHPSLHLHHFSADYLPHRLQLLAGELFWIQHILKHYGEHAFYFSPYTHPMMWRAKKNQYMTLHDAIFFRDNAYSAKWSRKLYNALTARTLRDKALSLITVSKTSSEDIQKTVHTDKAPYIIHNGIDHLQREPLLSREDTLKRFGIDDKYIFYHGGYDTRKNVQSVLDLFREVKKTHPALSLVLGGKPLYDSPLYARIEQEAGIIQTGFISPSELRSLYRHAECFVSLTQDEGFNIPIGEALMEGTPVVASDIAAHRELWQEYATLVSLTDQHETVQQTLSILASHSPVEHPKDMTWKECARKILEYFA